MVDVTTIVKEINVEVDFAEKLQPFLASFDPPVGALLLTVLKGVRAVESAIGVPASTTSFNPVAVAEVNDHNTPGAPNSPALS